MPEEKKRRRKMEQKCILNIHLRVKRMEETADWFCRNLFFTREESGRLLKNGSARLILETEEGFPAEIHGPEEMCLGFRHIALETYDIQKAIQYCKEKGLRLQLSKTGGAMHSGKVYGTGMDYFNILTDFGLTVEVSQKLHVKRAWDGPVIFGLDHIGLQVEDVPEAMRFYEKLGFVREFEPVVNESDGHQIICCMEALGDAVIELYDFHDQKNLKRQKNPVISGLSMEKNGGSAAACVFFYGPSGERLAFPNPPEWTKSIAGLRISQRADRA